jgi:hypothetical protein
MAELVTNSGNMFQEEGIHYLSDQIGVGDEVLRERFNHLTDYLERRQAALSKEPSATETSFYFLNRALHILGYVHSHNEPLVSGSNDRPDYTLFASSADFVEREASRGTPQFFVGALGVLKACAWLSEFDPAEPEEGAVSPILALDEQLRQTGLQWGILTNGNLWRLYHRNTCNLLTTYYEVNLLDILREKDFDAFRYFAGAFSMEALRFDDSGVNVVQQILN